MIDVSPLSFRDYHSLAKYDFESQFKFKVCMGDVSNIRNYEKLTLTGEYDRLINEVQNAE
jgi:predicted AAA+ superfamily ATPase